jgi:fumarylacetoacetase
MLLPVEVGDYVDFYSSEEHATNVGKMFRDPANPLLPNWKSLPVGYHGRSSSIILSGQDIRRPKGQLGAGEFGPTRQLDFELELGFIVGRSTALGTSVPIGEAEDCIFGMVLLNDWSARDIQRWEYVPLGPFLGKSFATSITPWIVTLDALEPFRVRGPAQQPAPLPYLAASGDRNLDIHLEVLLQPKPEAHPLRISRTNSRGIYWSMSQQVAHLTSNGTNLRVGDLCGTGTISGKEPDSFGSMLELAWNGTRPLSFPGGAERRFLEDGDTVVMRAWAERDDVRVGFGELKTRILPAG